MSIYLLTLAIIGTLFSSIMGFFVYRQVNKSKWIDSRVIPIFWIFILFVAILVIALWVLYFMSIQYK